MALWNVEFSYTIIVETDTMEQAEFEAKEQWCETMPRRDEMNIEVSNYVDDPTEASI